MLRINAIPNTSAAKNYYRSADYQLDGQEAPAHWHGKGAELLSLSGEIQREQFERLCDNQHPDTGKQLTAKHIENRRVGYDFTWSLPKSASVAYALGLDDRLPDAFRGAVADTMAEMEREMETRVRKGGRNENRQTGNMIWSDFMHFTSRPLNGHPDPQLHIHAVVFNATWDRDEQQWKAGEFAALKANAPYFQAAFRSRLAERLQGLGYEITRKKDDFEITGIPQRAVKEFSRRTEQIDKLADQLGVKKPETKDKLGATSRERKTKGLTWENLLELWQFRLKPGELEAINATVRDAMQGPMAAEDRSKESVDWALAHLLERKSVVAERAVVTEALKHGLGSVTPEDVWKEVRTRKDVIRNQMGGQWMVSTKGVLGEERGITRFAIEGRGRYKPLGRAGQPLPEGRGAVLEPMSLVKGDPVQQRTLGSSLATDLATPSPFGQAGTVRYFRTVDPRGDKSASTLDSRQNEGTNPRTLSPTQQAAIRHVWTSPDRLILIRGAAGTGKTTLTKAALAGVNVPWVILAPTVLSSSRRRTRKAKR